MTTINFINPLLWQSTPFRDADAWLDFLGMHERWHQYLAEALKGPWGLFDDLRTQLQAHDRTHRALADILAIPQAGDLSSFDLEDEVSFNSFMHLHARDHDRLRAAAGI